jgi:hypothetical protein
MKIKYTIPSFIILGVLASVIAYLLASTALKSNNVEKDESIDNINNEGVSEDHAEDIGGNNQDNTLEDYSDYNLDHSHLSLNWDDYGEQSHLIEGEAVVESDHILVPSMEETMQRENYEGYYIVMAYNGQITIFDYFLDDFDDYFYTALINNECEAKDRDLYKYYYLNIYGEDYLKEVIDMPISLLSKDEQDRLSKGIQVYGDDELMRLIENYTS